MDRFKELDFSDEVSNDEQEYDIVGTGDFAEVDLVRFTRDEGRIYESIEASLAEEEEVLSYDDLVDDELNDAVGG